MQINAQWKKENITKDKSFTHFTTTTNEKFKSFSIYFFVLILKLELMIKKRWRNLIIVYEASYHSYFQLQKLEITSGKC